MNRKAAHPLAFLALAAFCAVDTTPPAAIADLSDAGFGDTSITLAWTAPGDDGRIGLAHDYDIRYSKSSPLLITPEAWFAGATHVLNTPAPLPAGSHQTFTLTGLQADSLYYLGIKTADEVPNWSPVSNLISVHTLPGPIILDDIPPAAVGNLAPFEHSTTTITIQWVAPGDDDTTGTVTEYDIRVSNQPITTIGEFVAAPRVTPTMTIVPAGAVQSNVVIDHLSPGTLYYIGVRARDEVPDQWGPYTVISVSTAPAVPTPIDDLASSNITMTSLELRWSIFSDPLIHQIQYDVRVCETGPILTPEDFDAATPIYEAFPLSTETIETDPVDGHTIHVQTVLGLAPGTAYHFSVALVYVEPGHLFSVSNPVNVTALAPPPPPESRGSSAGSCAAGPGGYQGWGWLVAAALAALSVRRTGAARA